MLIVVRSPEPCLPLDAARWPAEAAPRLEALTQTPERCFWVVPSEFRRQAVEQGALAGGSAFVPRITSLDAFVRLVAPGSRIHPVERLIRLAQTWHDVSANAAGPQLLGALDRFVRDWQLSGLAPPTRPADFFETTVQRYLRDLESDGLQDEPEQLAALVRELGREDFPLPTPLASTRLVLLDGFVRLEVLHLRLLTELSRRIDTILWLPSLESSLAEEMLTVLRRRRVPIEVIEDEASGGEGVFVALAPRLFASDEAAPVESVAGLNVLEAMTPREELEQAARRIKADLRAAASAGQPLPLSGIALVVPDQEYVELAAHVLPRHGLPVRSAVPTSAIRTRPARFLASAWEVFASQWRYEALRDFLLQPVVRRRLANAEQLQHLFDHRPRARQQRMSNTWLDAWQRLADRASRPRAPDDAGTESTGYALVERERRSAERQERGSGLGPLVDSIRRVLAPLVAMEAILEGGAANPMALPALARACLGLFDAVDMAEWVSHAESSDRDRNAAALISATLRYLEKLPSAGVRLASLWQPNALDTLKGVLSGVAVEERLANEGIAVVLLEESGGLNARHVYVFGLQEGVQPAAAADELLTPGRARNVALRTQLRQRESATRGHFRSLFRSTGERLVLSRPTHGEEDTARPSEFLRAVQACILVPPLEIPAQASCLRDAAERLGRAYASRGAGEGTLGEWWPDAGEHGDLQLVHGCLSRWRTRPDWPRRNHLAAPFLLALRFPDELPYTASDLETYAACPFRYFALRVLELQERDADESRAHYGSLVHRVFQAFYDERRQLGDIAENEPLPPISTADAERLLALFDQEWRRLGEGLVPSELRTLFTSDQGVMQLFLDAMGLLEGKQGNLHNEFVVENVCLGKDAQGRPVYVKGRVDRIDRHRLAETAVILDYKTGRELRPAERQAKSADGRMIQLPLYAEAVSRACGIEVVGGAYVHISDRVVKVERAIDAEGELLFEGTRGSEVAFDREAARRKALELAGRIRAGDFSLTEHTHGRPHAECTAYCPARHACRAADGYKNRNV